MYAMNTRNIAEEYRLSHWVKIMQERRESGLSVRAYCKEAGFHENSYFYWQRKLREATCMDLIQNEKETTNLVTPYFTEIQVANQPEIKPAFTAETIKDQIIVETSGIHIKADSGYPIDKLKELLRMVLQPC